MVQEQLSNRHDHPKYTGPRDAAYVERAPVVGLALASLFHRLPRTLSYARLSNPHLSLYTSTNCTHEGTLVCSIDLLAK